MNKDINLIFEKYSKIYHESDSDFRDQMPDSREHAETTYGVDPKEAKAYDDARKTIDFEHYPFWDAFHAVKEGAWTEENFHQWASSVWSDGADHAQKMSHSEDAEEVHWWSKHVPYSQQNSVRPHITKDGREWVAWIDRSDDGDRYYYDYYVMYKGDAKPKEISEDEYRALYHEENAEDVTPNKAKHDKAFSDYEQKQKDPFSKILKNREKQRKDFRG